MTNNVQSARFLKGIVIVLGVAIVIALGFVVYGFVRLGTKAETASPSSSPIALSAVNDLGQPAGTEIVSVTTLGTSRLILALKGGSRPDRVVVVDLNSGKVASTTYTSPMTP